MKLLKLLAVTALLVCLSPRAAAAGGICYDGLAGDLVFLPDSDLIPLEMFSGWETLGAGRSLTERVRLSGSLEAERELLLYLCAEDAQQYPGLTLHIEGMGGRRVFYGTLERAGWVYLGTYGNGEGETLTLTLRADDALDGAVRLPDWRFLAVELPPAQDASPQTEDSFPLLYWLCLLLFSAGALALLPWLLCHYATPPKIAGKNCDI